jgi:hypothetical protein
MADRAELLIHQGLRKLRLIIFDSFIVTPVAL